MGQQMGNDAVNQSAQNVRPRKGAKSMTRILSAFVAITLLGTATPALATITFTMGDQGSGQGQEVLLNDSNTQGLTVLGHTNQSLDGITFTSSQIIGDAPNGQSLIAAFDAIGGDQTTLNNLTFFATDPTLGFSRVEFDLTNTANLGDAIVVTLSGIDQLGNLFTQNFTTHLNGQDDPVGTNWLIATASDGETIQSISFNTPDGTGFSDFRQLRLDFANGVPEPATWGLMLLGFGIIGSQIRRNRSRRGAIALA